MQKFTYTARDQTGTLLKGTLEAETERAVRRKIAEMGLLAITVRAGHEGRGLNPFAARVKSDDLVSFTWQLSAMVNAGLELMVCLAALREQTESQALKVALELIVADVRAGQTLSASLAKFPRIFSPLYVAMIKVGEVSGRLDEITNRLAIYLDKAHELRMKVRAAFTYPIIVCIMAVACVTFLLSFVVPVFAKVYKGAGVDLPGATRALIALSSFLVHYWWLVIIVIVGLVFSYWRYARSKSGRPVIDRCKLKAPIVGKLIHKVALSRVVRTLANMVSSGVPMLEALAHSRVVSGNWVISDAIERIEAEVREGSALAPAMKRTEVFLPMVIHMVGAGEESGELDDMLQRVSEFLDRDIDYAIKRLTTLLEPLLTVMLGFLVGFIAIAMYMPIFSIAKVIHK